MHELKPIADLYYRGVSQLMNYSVSDAAGNGIMTVGGKMGTEDTKNAMRSTRKCIQNGASVRQWLDKYQSGSVNFDKLRRTEAEHPLETAVSGLRKMMSSIE